MRWRNTRRRWLNRNGANIVYDSSGDIATNTFNPDSDKIYEPARKELVNAMRKFYHDDPKEEFESSGFETTPIFWALLYIVVFDAGGGGFKDTYGPPPYDKNNPYK